MKMIKRILLLTVATLFSAGSVSAAVIDEINADKATLDTLHGELDGLTGAALKTKGTSVESAASALLTKIDNAIANYDGAGTPAITGGADPLADAGERAAAAALVAPVKLQEDDGILAKYKGGTEDLDALRAAATNDSEFDSLRIAIESQLTAMRAAITAGFGNAGGLSVEAKHDLLVADEATTDAVRDEIIIDRYDYVIGEIVAMLGATTNIEEAEITEAGAYGEAGSVNTDADEGMSTEPNQALIAVQEVTIAELYFDAALVVSEYMAKETSFAATEQLQGSAKKTKATEARDKALSIDGYIDSFTPVGGASYTPSTAKKSRAGAVIALMEEQIELGDAQIKLEEAGMIILPADPVQMPIKVDEKKAKYTEAKGLLEGTGKPVEAIAAFEPTDFLESIRPLVVQMKQDVADLQAITNKSIDIADNFKEIDKRFNDVPVLTPGNGDKVRKAFDRVRDTGEVLMPLLDQVETIFGRLGAASEKVSNFMHDVRFEMDAMKYEADAVFANLDAHHHVTDVGGIVTGWQAGDAAGTIVESTAVSTEAVTALTTAEKDIVAKYVNSMENRTKGEFRRSDNMAVPPTTLGDLFEQYAGVAPVNGSLPGVRPHVHRQIEAVAIQLARGFDPESIMEGLVDVKTLFDKFVNLEGYAKAAHVWMKQQKAGINVDDAGAVSAAHTAWTSFLASWKTLLAEEEDVEGGGTEATFSTTALADFDKVISDHADITDIFAAPGAAAVAGMNTALPILETISAKAIDEFKRRLTIELEGLFLDIRNEEMNFDHDTFDGEPPSAAEIVNKFALTDFGVSAIDDGAFTAADKAFFDAIAGGIADKYIRFEPKHTHDWKQQVNVEIPLTTEARKAQIVVTGEGNDVTEFRQIAVSGIEKDQAQINVMMEKSGRIGLGGAGVNDNSVQALSVLGEDAVTIVPNGNGVVTLNADVIISSDQPFIPTPDFGNEENETVLVKSGDTCEYVTRKKNAPHRITFTSAVPHAIRVVRGATLDLTAFGTTGDTYTTNGKQISFDGEVSLVLEPGAKIRFPYIQAEREDQAPILYFNGNSKLIFEGSNNRDEYRWRKGHGEPVTVDGYKQDIDDIGGGTMRNYGTANDVRCKLLGVGKLWFNKNSRMEVMNQAMVGVESDYRSPKTSITVSLQRKAQFCVGSLDRAGGAFQVGNPVEGGARVDPVTGWDPAVTPTHPTYPNNADHPNYDPNDPDAFQPRACTVDFKLHINGTGAKFHIDREGFLGLGVGVVNKTGCPNGNIPDDTTDPLTDCDQFNAWRVQALHDVRNIVIDLKQGYFDHNKIADGSHCEASLMAIGFVNNRYEVHLGKNHEAIWRAGGNVVFVRPEVGSDGVSTDSALHPMPINIWSEASPLAGTTADSGKYSVLAPPTVMRGRGALGRATVVSGADSWVFKGPQEEAFLMLTMSDFKLLGERAVATGNNEFDTMVSYVIDEGSKKVIHRDPINKVLDEDNNPVGVKTAAEHGEMLTGLNDADGAPAEFLSQSNQ